MPEVQITFNKSQIKFLETYKRYSFKDENSLVREILKKFKKELKHKELEESAELYTLH